MKFLQKFLKKFFKPTLIGGFWMLSMLVYFIYRYVIPIEEIASIALVVGIVAGLACIFQGLESDS